MPSKQNAKQQAAARVQVMPYQDRDSLYIIALFANAKDCGVMRRVSKTWESVLCSNVLWKVHYIANFGERKDVDYNVVDTKSNIWRKCFYSIMNALPRLLSPSVTRVKEVDINHLETEDQEFPEDSTTLTHEQLIWSLWGLNGKPTVENKNQHDNDNNKPVPTSFSEHVHRLCLVWDALAENKFEPKYDTLVHVRTNTKSHGKTNLFQLQCHFGSSLLLL